LTPINTFRSTLDQAGTSVASPETRMSSLTRIPAGTDLADGKLPAGAAWRTRVSWIFGLLVLAAVITVALHLTELQRFAEIARAAHPIWLLAALLLQTVTYFAAAGVWWVVLKGRRQHPSYLSLVPMGLAKLFTDQALPTGGVGGTILVIRGLMRRQIPSGIAMSALLLGMTSYYTAYVAAVGTAMALMHFEGLLNGAMLAGSVAFACVAIAVPAIVLAIRRNIHKWPFTLAVRIPGFSTLLEAMREARLSLRHDWLPFLFGAILQLGVFVLDAATLWTVLRAAGSNASPVVAFVAFMSASVAATIGPMPLGLGTFEAASVAALHLQGQPIAVALTATLLLRGLTFWLPMVPGLLLARREVSKQS
jgi:uncharacterized protein (TIRG00374 family)